MQVTGYVLVVVVYADILPLTSLRIIRGKYLYNLDGKFYSVYIGLNYDRNKANVGIKELRFKSLHGEFYSIFFFKVIFLSFPSDTCHSHLFQHSIHEAFIQF